MTTRDQTDVPQAFQVNSCHLKTAAVAVLLLLWGGGVCGQTVTITSRATTAAEWFYVSDTASSVAEWYYFTDRPSSVAKWVYFTSNQGDADVILTSDLHQDTTWLYISDSASSVADWIYISDTASSVAEWVYVTDSPENADVVMFTDEPKLKVKSVIACVLEHLKKSRKSKAE